LQDLFGRGFSDNVGDAEHDARLYVAQVLMVLASSPLSWTGTKSFSLVGYSLGGGIAVHVSAAFGHMIDSLVLLAPSGLIRLANFGVVSRLLFKSGLVPPRVLGALTRWRLQQPIASSVSKGKVDVDEVDAGITAQGLKVVEDEDPVAAAMTETVPTAPGEEMLPLEKRILAHTRWMSIHHAGFVPAFMSSIKDAPLVGQEESYRQLARREKGSTVLIFGRDDQIVSSKDYGEDALPLIGGKEHVIWRVVSGSHDFPMTHADEVLDILAEVWHLQ
jgi:pimeloyl-ACP methyl ester carboxylesterase